MFSVNLRSKRFSLVSERKMIVEGDFWFWPREKWNQSPTPSPLFYLRHFSRGLWLLFLILCSKTTQKRLLRGLGQRLYNHFLLHNIEITEFVICGRKYYVFCFPYSGIFISPFLALLNAVSDCHLLNSYAFCYVSANLIMFSLRLGVFI